MNISQKITQYINEHSGFEANRKYLGMSHLSACPRQQYTDFTLGQTASDERHRGAFAGYAFERIMKDILIKSGVMHIESREIVAPFDSRLVGHTDGETMDGDLLEIKSVSTRKFERVVTEMRATHENFEQVQTYMHFGEYRRAHIIYVCREDFRHVVITIGYQQGVGMKMEEKAKVILSAIDSKSPPACECGRCK